MTHIKINKHLYVMALWKHMQRLNYSKFHLNIRVVLRRCVPPNISCFSRCSVPLTYGSIRGYSVLLNLSSACLSMAISLKNCVRTPWYFWRNIFPGSWSARVTGSLGGRRGLILGTLSIFGFTMTKFLMTFVGPTSLSRLWSIGSTFLILDLN